MDEQRGHVDEIGGGVDLGLLQVFDVGEELGRDPGDGDIVDVDVLLTNEVEEQVERAVVDESHGDAVGRGALLPLFGLGVG